MPKFIGFFIISFVIISSCTNHPEKKDADVVIIADGQMPAVASIDSNSLHIIFGKGDSLLYTSSNNKAISFSTPGVLSGH